MPVHYLSLHYLSLYPCYRCIIVVLSLHTVCMYIRHYLYYVVGSVYTYICAQPPRHYLFKGLCICERHYEAGQERVT